MSKAGASSAGSGPTAAAAASAAQKQKALLQKVDSDVTNIVDNFSYLINVARVCSQTCSLLLQIWEFNVIPVVYT